MKYTPLLPGQKFNKLKIISLHHKRLYINPKTNKKKYKEFYLCKCDFGNEIVVYKDNLKRKFIEYGGKVHCVSEWAEILGINPKKLFDRLSNGWPIKKLFNK